MLSEREKMPTVRELSDAEFDIMRVVWRSGKKNMLSTEIQDALPSMGWKLPELMTFLKRLEKKGYLRCNRTGRRNEYAYVNDENCFISKMLVDLMNIHCRTFYDILKIAIADNIITEDDGLKCKELLFEHYRN